MGTADALMANMPDFERMKIGPRKPSAPAPQPGEDRGKTIEELQEIYNRLYPGGNPQVRDAYKLPGTKTPEALLAETLGGILGG